MRQIALRSQIRRASLSRLAYGMRQIAFGSPHSRGEQQLLTVRQGLYTDTDTDTDTATATAIGIGIGIGIGTSTGTGIGTGAGTGTGSGIGTGITAPPVYRSAPHWLRPREVTDTDTDAAIVMIMSSAYKGSSSGECC